MQQKTGKLYEYESFCSPVQLEVGVQLLVEPYDLVYGDEVHGPDHDVHGAADQGQDVPDDGDDVPEQGADGGGGEEVGVGAEHHGDVHLPGEGGAEQGDGVHGHNLAVERPVLQPTKERERLKNLNLDFLGRCLRIKKGFRSNRPRDSVHVRVDPLAAVAEPEREVDDPHGDRHGDHQEQGEGQELLRTGSDNLK